VELGLTALTHDRAARIIIDGKDIEAQTPPAPLPNPQLRLTKDISVEKAD